MAMNVQKHFQTVGRIFVKPAADMCTASATVSPFASAAVIICYVLQLCPDQPVYMCEVVPNPPP